MNRKYVRSRIQEIGIIPSVRVSSAQDARFAAENIFQGGIPIVEIGMTVPGAIQVISDLAKNSPDVIVGAGGVMDAETARKCIEAGAKFLTTDGVILEVVEFASMAGIVIFPGALTPTEVITAWRAGSDFVKVVPCAAIGGKEYLKSLTIALPDIPLIAAGGINQQTAEDYLEAGAIALGIGEALIPSEAIAHRQPKRIHELARRFLQFVKLGRLKNDSRIYEAVVDRTQNLHLENVAT